MCEIRKYTANYAYTNPNFVIQNLVTVPEKEGIKPLLYVLKNILQRGFPTVMSKFLQKEIGAIHNMDSFDDRFLFVTDNIPHWYDTIKGDAANNYNPAKYFFENILPCEFREYPFLCSLIVPEIQINDIIDVPAQEFMNQQVDFYLPQAKLVIEIDGQQHRQNVQFNLDAKRDNYLAGKGIETVRITTQQIQTNNYQEGIGRIRNRINQFANMFNFYQIAYNKLQKEVDNDEIKQTKILPTAIIRFQILVIELLLNQYLNFASDWKFNIRCDEEHLYGNFAQLAIKDLVIWLTNLSKLRDKKEPSIPEFFIKINNSKNFNFDPQSINIDFSLFKRYTDENHNEPDMIFVRTDYFDVIKDKNYFRVSTTDPINYNIVENDKPTLRFFLQNLFDKQDFREGQFAIMSNALNRNDTIGLLPTGGGKSLCYQLPCMLQPSISFVVCPIKSLMYDQAENIKQKSVLITNIDFMCGDLNAQEKTRVLNNYSQGKYLWVWISPERFQIPNFRDSVRTIVNNFSIAYAVIDEVHCLSEWGHDFRTSYLNLAKTIESLSPKDQYGEGVIKYIGLTATASVNVLKDIKVEFSRQTQSLDENNIKTLLDYSRKELQFEVINDNQNKFQKLQELLDNENFINDEGKAGIVFTPNVNGSVGCYNVANLLEQHYPGHIGWYSGSCPRVNGLPIMSEEAFNQYKVNIQKEFKDNKKNLLCATKAFGMGIDKANIFYTFHYGLPSSVEALYQEAGRAGRWDKRKPENASKKGKCYVLHSHEAAAFDNYVQQLFDINTTFSQIENIQRSVGYNGRDVFKQIFLFVQGQKDVKDDFQDIKKVINLFFEENSTVIIYHSQIRSICSIDLFEKIIYRLSLLGIVKDWTRDFVNMFSVEFVSTDSKHIINSLKNYILKYNPDTDIEESIQYIENEYVESFLDKSIWYLLTWIFEHIVYSRKQSLKTVSQWCLEYTTSEEFKKRIDSYFTFNDTTYVLQYIADHPLDVKRWFEVFYNNKRIITEVEIKKMKDRISRFLESYNNNAGLNFVSGFVRLRLNEYADTDGKARLEDSLETVSNRFEPMQQEQFINELISFAKRFLISDDQKLKLSLSILKYWKNLVDRLAKAFKLPILWVDTIAAYQKELRKLNIKILEKYGRF
jgi:ATP-dependent DNA helicase RecQ